MNLLPLPADLVLSIHKRMGLQYFVGSNFMQGIPQNTFINSCGLIFAWTGKIDKNGYYFYKTFNKINGLTFR